MIDIVYRLLYLSVFSTFFSNIVIIHEYDVFWVNTRLANICMKIYIFCFLMMLCFCLLLLTVRCLLLQIYVYYNVQLPSMRAKRFIPEQLAAVEKNPRRAQQLMEWCLYGRR